METINEYTLTVTISNIKKLVIQVIILLLSIAATVYFIFGVSNNVATIKNDNAEMAATLQSLTEKNNALQTEVDIVTGRFNTANLELVSSKSKIKKLETDINRFNSALMASKLETKRQSSYAKEATNMYVSCDEQLHASLFQKLKKMFGG